MHSGALAGDKFLQSKMFPINVTFFAKKIARVGTIDAYCTCTLLHLAQDSSNDRTNFDE